jgi:hypothetical protein
MDLPSRDRKERSIVIAKMLVPFAEIIFVDDSPRFVMDSIAVWSHAPNRACSVAQ